MGSYMNFNLMAAGGKEGERPISNYLPLTRQTSVYSLTFDELQSAHEGFGRDLGSVYMDDFLKSIWTAEETQCMASSFCKPEVETSNGGTLQEQGLLTLPQVLSQKTVDEVWRDMFRESWGKDGAGSSSLNLKQRLQTLGEITLEEFLVKAAVKEDAQSTEQLDNRGFNGELSRSNNNSNLGLGFPHSGHSNGVVGMNRIFESNNQIPQQSPNLVMNANAARTLQQQQQLFPKQPNAAYASSMQLRNNVESGNPGVRSSTVGMVGLGAAGVTVAVGSPGNHLSSDGLGQSNGDASLAPVPYVFGGGLRGRRSGAVEKVVERRQRRMIKNRESAARSRARKQAYTMELEDEVAKLKEENKELKKKQAIILEMQKHQVLDITNQQHGSSKQGLRRTQTGPW